MGLSRANSGQRQSRVRQDLESSRLEAIQAVPDDLAREPGAQDAGSCSASDDPRPEAASSRKKAVEINPSWREALPYVVSALIAAWLYHVSDGFADSQMPGRIGPDAWPKIALGLMFFVSCLGVVKVALKMRGTLPPTRINPDRALLHPPELYPHLVWIAIVATGVYIWAWNVLGYFLSTILYSLLLMWIGHQRRSVVLAGCSVGFAVFFLFLFMKVVYVALPLGEGPFSKVSLALMSVLGIR